LGEKTSKLDYLAAFTIMGGIGLTVAGSSSAPKDWTTAAILKQFKEA
jgi:hypothetical protein